MTLSIAIASGKGGVGKTNCAVNLALSLAALNKKTILFDTDFGMANAHILLGSNPEYTAADFLRGQATWSDVMSSGPAALRFIAGGSGLLDMLHLDNQARYRMLQALSALEDEIDVLIVDTPAGATDSTLFFTSACAVPLIVLVAEPTSFVDAYALIKAAHIDKKLNQFSICVNMAEDESDARRNFDKFFEICRRFLDVNLHYAGMVPLSHAIRKSIVSRQPIVSTHPQSAEARAFAAIAESLQHAPDESASCDSFFLSMMI